MVNVDTYTYRTTPDEVIQKAVNKQCPDGYSMIIKNQDEWFCIAEAVNQGIDSYLEALTERSLFDNGTCLVHPDELHVLLRRMAESGREEAIELRLAILYTLDIEEI